MTDMYYVAGLVWTHICSLIGKKKFTYRECGLKSLDIRLWSKDTKQLIMKINDLFKQIFGGAFFTYTYSKDHGNTTSCKNSGDTSPSWGVINFPMISHTAAPLPPLLVLLARQKNVGNLSSQH